MALAEAHLDDVLKTWEGLGGGIVLAIQTELGIPVKLVGLGEGIDDLVVFDADEFVEALFN